MRQVPILSYNSNPYLSPPIPISYQFLFLLSLYSVGECYENS
jgi:hypothetical protein